MSFSADVNTMMGLALGFLVLIALIGAYMHNV